MINSGLMTGFAKRVTPPGPQLVEELLFLPEHLSSPQCFVEFVLLDH
jgi:hypothetical protein